MMVGDAEFLVAASSVSSVAPCVAMQRTAQGGGLGMDSVG